MKNMEEVRIHSFAARFVQGTGWTPHIVSFKTAHDERNALEETL